MRLPMCCWTIRDHRASSSRRRAISGTTGCCRWRTTSAPGVRCAQAGAGARTTRSGPTMRNASSNASKRPAAQRHCASTTSAQPRCPDWTPRTSSTSRSRSRRSMSPTRSPSALADVGYPRIEHITGDTPHTGDPALVAQATSRRRRSRAAGQRPYPRRRLAGSTVRAVVPRLADGQSRCAARTIWRSSARRSEAPDYAEAKEPWFAEAYGRAWEWADSTGWRP